MMKPHNEEENDMDMSKFINPNDVRPLCREPYLYRGKTLFTNGVILFLSDKQIASKGLPPASTASIEPLYEQLINREFMEYAAIAVPEKGSCSLCEGVGKLKRATCPECDGDGEVDIDNDYNTYRVECRSCEGDGGELTQIANQECYRCDGSGISYQPYTPVNVGGVSVDANLMELVINEPGIRFSPCVEKCMLFFKCTEGMGIIMGLNLAALNRASAEA